MTRKAQETAVISTRLPLIQVEKLEREADRQGLSRAALTRRYLDCILDEAETVEQIQHQIGDSAELIATLQTIRNHARALFPDRPARSTDGPHDLVNVMLDPEGGVGVKVDRQEAIDKGLPFGELPKHG